MYGQVSHCLFFFQAEDGIRDYKVTGVQTCALPISHIPQPFGDPSEHTAGAGGGTRSEERRVGKSVDLGGRRIIKKKKKSSLCSVESCGRSNIHVLRL